MKILIAFPSRSCDSRWPTQLSSDESNNVSSNNGPTSVPSTLSTMSFVITRRNEGGVVPPCAVATVSVYRPFCNRYRCNVQF